MTDVALISLTPAMALSCVVVVELFFRLPFLAHVEAVNRGAMRALTVVRAPHISDHWKERVLPTYAGRILRASLALGGLLLLCALVFVAVWVAAASWPAGGVHAAFVLLGSGVVQLCLLGVGVAWALVRSRMGAGDRGGAAVSEYSPASQMLHRLALGTLGMRSLCDDLDRRLAGRRAEAVVVDRPVYVAALARAGTTVLLEAIHASGQFASLTYRSMPFVMAPWTWGAISRPRRAKPGAMKERAHGDRIKVGVDSPEAFEEVFWNTYAARATLDLDGLKPAGAPAAPVLERYRHFVRRLLARDARYHGPRRYLCKNNNHLLRLPWLRAAFPDALVVTPFRHPADHVQSLMRQHERFLARHAEDPFALEYMDWLGHHEFGAHFLPFKLGDGLVPEDAEALQDPAYWVRYWTAVHAYVLEHHGEAVAWFDYDAFCAAPGDSLAWLEAWLGLKPASLTGFARRVSKSSRKAPPEILAAIDEECLAVHAQLQARAREQRREIAPAAGDPAS